MQKETVSFERIERFLEGRDEQQFIVAIEAPYHINKASLIINHPVKGKIIEDHEYKPFLYMKHEVSSILYGGGRSQIINAMAKYGVTIKALRITDSEGNKPKRLDEGFKYLATTTKAYTNLINFFKDGGIDVFSQEHKPLFQTFAPAEQFMIQTGKRLFKGIDNYNDVHRFQFDLETEGLDASRHGIFLIGIRDNKGFELVLETKGDTIQERRDSERLNICTFFETLHKLRPDIISGYNSENFDWSFFVRRCERLSINIGEVAQTLNPTSKFKRKPGIVKFGQETESYEQTLMWGFNIIDVSHAVRKAQAINSDIKKWSLKYITKYSGIAKPNRVYIPEGDKIFQLWNDNRSYWFNDTDGSYGPIEDTDNINELPKHLMVVKTAYIVKRYLLDDLWETEHVDTIYNQAAFLVGKLLPTSYQRSSTMGTAGQWKLIMAAWSYENNLAIPNTESKQNFTGGLSRLLQVGYAETIDKLDYAALYPKTQLTHDIFPELDISGVMKGLLTYIVDTRDKFKFMASNEKAEWKKLQKLLDANIHNLSPERIVKAKEMIYEHKQLMDLYDKKQLPLKILANSFFGAYGAPYIFNWGDTDCAEETTCRGRQYLRLMANFFTEKYGFKPILIDTDGINFVRPKTIDNVKYIAKGNHWKTKKYVDKELIGVNAVLAEFNENHLTGRMGLDLDDSYESTINFARKNYANLLDGKIKLVGNSIKSKKMPIYIEEFINDGIKLLLNGDGHSFIQLYNDYVDKIYNYQIPLVKIASKAKIKKTVDQYKKNSKMTNKAGNLMPKQAHMELVIKENINVDLGDVIYYVNIGKIKSHGDLKTEKNKETGEVTTVLNCKLIPNEQIENNPTLTTDEYNVPRYLAAFNKRIKPILVCFSADIRNNILLDIKKDKKTKEFKLDIRKAFTKEECKLVAGQPMKPEDQDSYEEDLMKMEDKEIKFWLRVDKIPNNMEESKWDEIKLDYHERMRIAKLEGIKQEKEKLDSIFLTLEANELSDIEVYGEFPIEINMIAELHPKTNELISLAWHEPLCHYNDIFKYVKLAHERNDFYNKNSISKKDKDRYEKWLNYIAEIAEMVEIAETEIISGETSVKIQKEYDTEVVAKLSEKINLINAKPKKNNKKKEEDDEYEDDEEDNDEQKSENIEDVDNIGSDYEDIPTEPIIVHEELNHTINQSSNNEFNF